MKTGRELDALIAEKVMGLKDENGFYVTLDCPHYSTDISSAWEVVEKISPFYGLSITGVGTEWVCIFAKRTDIGPGKHYEIIANSAPHAICLAALAAVGVEVE